MALLERDEALAALNRALSLARTGGQLVAVSGEAGIGKSTLVQAWTTAHARTVRTVWGYCEALGTPRPLGPLLDMAPGLGGTTSAVLASGAPRHEVFAAFLADLGQLDESPVVCFEDVHWADDATLDLLQFVARRLHMTRAVVVMTWRADEIAADHPIHRVLSAALPVSVHRIALAPLSLEAVRQLAGAHDARAVHATTGGNPFFVTELLATPAEGVPASVRDAVLARRTRLAPDARAVLDLVAVVPSRIELSLLAAAVGHDLSGLEGCVTGGLLLVDAGTVSFRHELARLAVAMALPAPRAQACHRQVLSALLARPERDAVLARIIHHAESAAADAVVVEYAPAAARQAARVGAHRQALEHFQRALRHASLVPASTRLELIEAVSYEHYLTGDISSSQQARREALDVALRISDRVAVGRNTRWLSRLAWFAGDGAEALARADEAVSVLSSLPPGAELAMAYSNRSQVAMLREEYDDCVRWGDQAIALARALGAQDILSHALNNVGTTRAQAGETEGRVLLEESLALALAGDLHEHVARAYTNLGSTAVELRAYDTARGVLDAGLAYCAERDLDSWTHYMLSTRARLRAETSLWEGAADDAERVLQGTRVAKVSRMVALYALGLVRTRRGDPDSGRTLGEALELARATGEPQRLIPILLASAEDAWRAGDMARTVAASREVLAGLHRAGRTFDRDRAWYWLWRAGEADPSEVSGDGPDARLIRGDWRGAADAWHRIGCPYERARALAEGPKEGVHEALDVFHALGAAPAADWARQRLRELGVASVPRGRRSSTLSHPAGLTVREAEVLALVAAGLTNSQIADRLFVSAKTVEHHVSSILGKLNVQTRDAAVAHGRAQGWFTRTAV